ncbi:uncharacterized protein LOC116660291 isoform X2 [Camelus ferus]|uniref:Uncharacterized protein LOC116660291 isoform X2 n=1 Tax=Camelus ferus TaxID=419612 RepID=A0A8B8S730_CAMFR|nr:uncharacterized protein LOC116660291 isoform X2 [Camelus ferus]
MKRIRNGGVLLPQQEPGESTLFHSYNHCLAQWAPTGEVSTIKFFLSEVFLGQLFEAVELEGSQPELGDLFLLRLMSPTGRWCGAHVGVYCGQGEIIHFQGKNPGGHKLHTFLGYCEGIVSKQRQRLVLCARCCAPTGFGHMLRKCRGIDHSVLERCVHKAMDADPPSYHPMWSNGVHFALHLLSLDPLQEDQSPTSPVSTAQLPTQDLTPPPEPVNKCS